MNSRLWLQLLASRPRRGHRKERGFALALALFVALTVMVGWVALANRSSSSRLGAALQEDNREARMAAESGLAMVIDELNRPANRMILAKGQMIGDANKDGKPEQTVQSGLVAWDRLVTAGSPLINPCANLQSSSVTTEVRPTQLISTIGSSAAVPLKGESANGETRQFRLVRYRLKNADRSTDAAYSPDQINLRPDPGKRFPKRGVGYVELTVEGQVRRWNPTTSKIDTVASSTVTQEMQVVPKCCLRSFRGPGDTSRQSDRSPEGLLPGIYGDDNRFCNNAYPGMLLGTGNRVGRNDGGLFLVNSSTPDLRNQDNPTQRPIKVPCFTTQASCAGNSVIDGVPVMSDSRTPPTAPVLGADGIPCDDEDLECIKKGIDKAKSFSSRSIELLNVNDGAKNNSKDDKFAKDYIRVNGKNVEICNKEYSGDKSPTSATTNRFDQSPEIVPGSCELLYDASKPNDSKNVCARQEQDGFISYHCRISNIFVNDFDAKDEKSVRANNTLFIDSTGNPETPNPRINLHINEDWAKTKLNTKDPADQPLIEQMKQSGLSPLGFRSVYSVGGYNDGQIQHVNCGSRSSVATSACLTPAEPNKSTRAAIISSCRREFNPASQSVVDTCERDKRASNVMAEVGDDGYMRGLFLFTPFSTVTIYGDPTTDAGWDKEDLDQGRPQLAAAVWAHRLRYVNRTTETYVPGPNSDFFGMETSWDDRYSPRLSFDYALRGTTGQSLFSVAK